MALFSHLMKDVLSTLLPFAHFLEVAFFGCIRKQDRSYFDSKTCWFKTAVSKVYKNIPKNNSKKSLRNSFKTTRGLAFWYQKLFWPSVRNFLKLRSLEQYIQTMKDQSNNYSWRFLRSNILEQFKLEKIIWIEKYAGKVRKLRFISKDLDNWWQKRSQKSQLIFGS